MLGVSVLKPAIRVFSIFYKSSYGTYEFIIGFPWHNLLVEINEKCECWASISNSMMEVCCE